MECVVFFVFVCICVCVYLCLCVFVCVCGAKFFGVFKMCWGIFGEFRGNFLVNLNFVLDRF